MTIIIHHLHYSQSERIPWLCEELGLNYELKAYSRTPRLAPLEYKALHPMGAAPVVQDGDLTLAESCAIIEYICHKYADGRLFIRWPQPSYVDFLYWWHWVEGTFQVTISHAIQEKPGDESFLATLSADRLKRALEMLDSRLHDNVWLAGSEFTVADIMAVCPLTTFRYIFPFSLREYPNIVNYLQRIGAREAYQKAMKKSDPDMELALGPEPPKLKRR